LPLFSRPGVTLPLVGLATLAPINVVRWPPPVPPSPFHHRHGCPPCRVSSPLWPPSNNNNVPRALVWGGCPPLKPCPRVPPCRTPRAGKLVLPLSGGGRREKSTTAHCHRGVVLVELRRKCRFRQRKIKLSPHAPARSPFNPSIHDPWTVRVLTNGRKRRQPLAVGPPRKPFARRHSINQKGPEKPEKQQS